jgi:hypothetical protein
MTSNPSGRKAISKREYESGWCGRIAKYQKSQPPANITSRPTALSAI